MKLAKRFSALVLALVMVLAIGVSAFAGTGGSITVENSSKERKYTLYRVFSATVGSNGEIAYQMNSGKTLPTNDYFAVDAKGNVVVQSAAKSGDALSADAVTWLKGQVAAKADFIVEVTSKQGTGKALKFESLDLGYYFINTNVGSAVTVDSTDPDVVLIDKNPDGPSPIPETGTDPIPYKTVVTENGLATETTADAGKKLTFQISIKATNFKTEEDGTSYRIKAYTIKESPTNLTIDWSSVKVTVDGVELTKDTAYTVDENNKKINIKWAELVSGEYTDIYSSPAKLVVTYDAVMGVDEASNSADLKYVINKEGKDIEEPVIEDPPVVKVENFSVKAQSFVGTEIDNQKLSGCTYKLYKEVGETSKTKYYYKYDSENEVVSWVTDEAEATPVSSGCSFVGLENGTYYVDEVSVPSGYTVIVDAQTAEINGADIKVNFYHQKGLELPATGGIGTTIFYVMGGVLVAGAAVLLVVRKRMAGEQ